MKHLGHLSYLTRALLKSIKLEINLSEYSGFFWLFVQATRTLLKRLRNLKFVRVFSMFFPCFLTSVCVSWLWSVMSLNVMVGVFCFFFQKSDGRIIIDHVRFFQWPKVFCPKLPAKTNWKRRKFSKQNVSLDYHHYLLYLRWVCMLIESMLNQSGLLSDFFSCFIFIKSRNWFVRLKH